MTTAPTAYSKQESAMDSPQLEMPLAAGGGRPINPNVGSANLIPFPIAARVAFIERTAEIAASYRNPGKYLASVYRQQECSLRRRFPEDTVKSEMAAFDRAVQACLGEYA
jgi:hypothetical protein